jgi:hypothetical protein
MTEAPLPVQVARPGDTLILTFATAMSDEEFNQVLASLRAKIPDGIHITVIERCTGAIICRPDAEG